MKIKNITVPDIIKELEDEIKLLKNDIRHRDKSDPNDQNEIWHSTGYIDACALTISRLKQMQKEQGES